MSQQIARFSEFTCWCYRGRQHVAGRICCPPSRTVDQEPQRDKVKELVAARPITSAPQTEWARVSRCRGPAAAEQEKAPAASHVLRAPATTTLDSRSLPLARPLPFAPDNMIRGGLQRRPQWAVRSALARRDMQRPSGLSCLSCLGGFTPPAGRRMAVSMLSSPSAWADRRAIRLRRT